MPAARFSLDPSLGAWPKTPCPRHLDRHINSCGWGEPYSLSPGQFLRRLTACRQRDSLVDPRHSTNLLALRNIGCPRCHASSSLPVSQSGGGFPSVSSEGISPARASPTDFGSLTQTPTRPVAAPLRTGFLLRPRSSTLLTSPPITPFKFLPSS